MSKVKSKRHEAQTALKKCTFTLHTEPSSVTTAHNAMLLTLLTHAWDLSLKLPPGDVTYPVHVVIEFEGQKCCGEVRPVEDADAGPVGHSIFREPGSSSCN